MRKKKSGDKITGRKFKMKKSPMMKNINNRGTKPKIKMKRKKYA